MLELLSPIKGSYSIRYFLIYLTLLKQAIHLTTAYLARHVCESSHLGWVDNEGTIAGLTREEEDEEKIIIILESPLVQS